MSGVYVGTRPAPGCGYGVGQKPLFLLLPPSPLPQGDVQQLLMVADPEAARSYCQLYMPDCDQPLLYPLLAPFPEDVSTQTGTGKGWGTPSGAPPYPAGQPGQMLPGLVSPRGELPGLLTPPFLSPLVSPPPLAERPGAHSCPTEEGEEGKGERQTQGQGQEEEEQGAAGATRGLRPLRRGQPGRERDLTHLCGCLTPTPVNPVALTVRLAVVCLLRSSPVPCRAVARLLALIRDGCHPNLA